LDWRQTWKEILELVYPPRCGVCQRLGEPALCPACEEGIEYLQPPYCYGCGKALLPTMGEGALCGECRLEPPDWVGARAVGLHRGVLRDAILAMKFKSTRELVEPLGRLLAERVEAEPRYPRALDFGRVEGIIPVALHPRRRAERGFDQSSLMAREMGRRLGLPVVEDLLSRVKHTKRQSGLSQAQRQRNLQGAFRVKDKQLVRGGRFLVVDDVNTTGSTLQAVVGVLRRADAAEIYALTVTRTLPSWHQGALVTWGDEQDTPEGG
jgi:ComF family protein